MNVSKNLLRDSRFSPLFWTQFLGAFNDNIFKNALVILITMRAFSFGSVSSEQMVAVLVGFSSCRFSFSLSSAGQVADSSPNRGW